MSSGSPSKNLSVLDLDERSEPVLMRIAIHLRLKKI
jgi:hypothetical protein